MSERPSLRAYLAERRGVVEAALDTRLPASCIAPEEIHEAMRYAVFSGGKRLRAIMSLEVAALAGAAPESVLDTACAIELTHTASLILDDLPCMDDAKTRRGLPCTHIKFGECTALLATVALLSEAFSLVTQNAAAVGRPELAPQSASLLSSALGDKGLVFGQHLDMLHTGMETDLDTLEKIRDLKAGVLFSAALRLPMRLLEMDSSKQTALACYARNVGLAFQITDDLLDEATPGEDAGKSTFTTHLGREGAQEKVRLLLEEAVESLSVFGDTAHWLEAIAHYVFTRNS